MKKNRKRKNQVIEWSFTNDQINKNTEIVVEFLKRLGFRDDQNIQLVLKHEVEKWILDGEKTIKQIKSETLADLYINTTMNIKDRKVPAKKYLKTENENGFGAFFAISGKRKGNNNVYVHVIDWDKGKEIKQFKTEDEAKQQQAVWSAQIGTEFKSVDIKVSHDDKTKEPIRYTVEAHRTTKRIQELKRKFRKDFKNELETAIIIETKNGFHCYWVIKHGSRQRFKLIQEALVRKFDSDSKVTDMARILRLPCFYHLKDVNDPFWVDVIHWGKQTESGEWVTYTQDELIQFLDLNVSEQHLQVNDFILPDQSVKKVVNRTNLKLKDDIDVTLSKTRMSFVEFVDEIKQVPFHEFFENEEFENTEKAFCCHFHDDEHPSATLYEMHNGNHMYRCFSDNCAQQYRSVIDLIIEVFALKHETLSFMNAVQFLAGEVGVMLEMDEFQQKAYQTLTFNTQWIKRNLECKNKDLSSFPTLYELLTKPYKRVLKEAISYQLLVPMKKEWSYKGMPIFFMSYEYLSNELDIAESKAKQFVNFICLLGLLDKLHHANVPDGLYRGSENQKTINYYTMPEFDTVAKDAEKRAKRLKRIKFKKREIDFEYIASGLGLKEARRVYPNDQSSVSKPKKAETHRKTRQKVETALSFLEKTAKETIRKKKYIKETVLMDKLKQQKFPFFSKVTGEKITRHLMDGEVNAIYENFKIKLAGEGYKRAKLSQKLAKALGLKSSDSSIYVWIKE